MEKAIDEKTLSIGSQDGQGEVGEGEASSRKGKATKWQLMPHHVAWLAFHPERSTDWFIERMAEGFQVHHVDGDHGNDHPHNLVLIEGSDHMRLHGIFRLKRNPGHMSKIGTKGGTNSRKNLGKRKRRQLAVKAANVRWKKHRDKIRRIRLRKAQKARKQ